jgi:hypothetical protein
VQAWQGHSKPNERQKGIGKPIHPTEVLLSVAIHQDQVHPNVQNFVSAFPRKEIRSEAISAKILSRDVIVALERSDAPA